MHIPSYGDRRITQPTHRRFLVFVPLLLTNEIEAPVEKFEEPVEKVEAPVEKVEAPVEKVEAPVQRV